MRKIDPSVFCSAKSSSPFKGAKVKSGMSVTRVKEILNIEVKKQNLTDIAIARVKEYAELTPPSFASQNPPP